MAFFANAAINRLNAQATLRGFALNAAGIFILISFIRAGLPPAAALAAQAAIFLGRFAVRPLLLPVAKRWGVKPILIGGALGVALEYPVVAQVRGVDAALLLACAITAVAEASFWVGNHTYFATLGHAEQRGRQLAAAELLLALSGVVGPLFGAWSLLTLGAGWTFGIAGAVQALSAIPLFGLPNLRVAAKAPGSWRAARPGILLMASDGWLDGSFGFVWPLLLFAAVGESLGAYGGAMTLAALAGAVASLVVGSDVDAGNGRRAVLSGYGTMLSVVVVRAVSLGSGLAAIVANGLGGIAMPMLVPPLATATHNIAAQSPCAFRGKLAAEGGWDAGASSACLAAALAMRAGLTPQTIALFGVPALVASAALLTRYYRLTQSQAPAQA